MGALVLCNLRYPTRVLEQWKETEAVTAPEKVARLSPLLPEHVNKLGRYCSWATAPALQPG
ncbi:MAG: Tn3 family transposase [Hymenobacter sp.]|nr:Tn3 family transposase [Hymenobacter sp.]